MLSITNKKGQVTSFLPQLVLVILAFVLIAMVLGRFMTDVNDVAAEQLCHDSISMRAASVMQVAGAEITLTPSLCKTIDKKVEGDREEIKEQMADLMARCWWMFNEGRYDDLLDSNEISNFLGWEDFENKCFICYSAMINEEEIGGGSITKTEMFNYLMENQYYKVNGTYVDYIQSYGGPGAPMIMGDIEPEEAYAITFLAKSTDNSKWTIVDWGAITVAIGATVVAVGAVACLIAEPCGLIVGTVLTGGLATGTAATATATGVVATGAFLTADAAGAYVALHALDMAVSQIYEEERGVSMVSISTLSAAQMADCVITDVAGE